MSYQQNKKREKWRNWYYRIKKRVTSLLGGKCACCGLSDYRFLTIDHTNGDGGSGRKRQTGTGRNLYRELWAFYKENGKMPDGLQILCWNCNCARGQFGICPHKELVSDID